MQHTLYDKAAAEAAQKNKLDMSKVENDEKPEVVVAPVRVKFGRAESDSKKKRREESALHKQKLIDEDKWIELESPAIFCNDPDFPMPTIKTEND